MTTTDQRISIAAQCGWSNLFSKPEGVYGLPPGRKQGRYLVPNYPGCLNAMAQAESMLTDDGRGRYIKILHDVTDAEMWGGMAAICATAAQRAEAFLRSLGAWVEANDPGVASAPQDSAS